MEFLSTKCSKHGTFKLQTSLRVYILVAKYQASWYISDSYPRDISNVSILVVGGGGGSGRSATDATTSRTGGSGGGGGSIIIKTFQASQLPSALFISIAKGGAGGAGRII